MKKQVLYIIALFCLFSCSDRYASKTDITDVIPKNHHTIIKVNALVNLKTVSNHNYPFNQLKIETLLNKVEFLNTTSPLYISKSDTEVLYITNNSETLFPKDSTLNIKTKKNAESKIQKNIRNKDTLYYRVIDNLFVASSQPEHLESIKKTKKPELKKLLATTNEENVASIVYQNQEKNELLLKNDSISNTNEVLDLEFNNNRIAFSGISKSNDSLNKLNAFKNTLPQKFLLAEIIPADIEEVTRIAFDDYSIFAENLETINSTKTDSLSSLLNLSNEIALLKTNQGNAIAIHALDSDLLNEALNTSLNSTIFKSISIFEFENPSLFKHKLKPFFQLKKASFGFTFENFAIFSDNKKVLETIISSKLNNQTLSNSEKFSAISQKLAEESSYLIYKNEKGLKNLLSKNPNGFNANALQYVYDTNFAHINGIYSKYSKRYIKNKVSEDFTINLTTDIISEPQVVKNHTNNTFNIAVQDVNNQLHLYSSKGNLLFKKELNGQILGKIKQIDIYKNGRLQLVFATQSRLYVLDKNGKDVGVFPIKFNDNITQPLSVFDYDNKRNYRLLVTQGKSLIMYDAKGKRINGFKYKKAANTISSQPKHFRIGNKDYIVFSQGEKLEILNRQGKERVKVQRNISFSKNEIYLYQNKFTTLSKNGQLVQVDTRGRVNFRNLNFTPETKLDATSKTLVGLTENKLKIKSKTVDLDYGNFTAPKIFYLQDKIYVTTTDLQTKKVYIYDSQAKLLPNFPVFGNSSAKLENLDKKQSLELITQSDSKTIIVYKIN